MQPASGHPYKWLAPRTDDKPCTCALAVSIPSCQCLEPVWGTCTVVLVHACRVWQWSMRARRGMLLSSVLCKLDVLVSPRLPAGIHSWRPVSHLRLNIAGARLCSLISSQPRLFGCVHRVSKSSPHVVFVLQRASHRALRPLESQTRYRSSLSPSCQCAWRVSNCIVHPCDCRYTSAVPIALRP